MYKAGDLDGAARRVAHVIAQSDKVAVYFTTNNELCWELDDSASPPANHLHAINRFDSLYLEVRALPPTSQYQAKEALGGALFSALDHDDPSRTDEYFAPVAAHIQTLFDRNARFVYVVGALGAALVLLTTCVVVALTQIGLKQVAALAAIGGGLGGLVSVLLRTPNLTMDVRARVHYIALDGCSRIVLGALFGLVAVLAKQANLVAGVLPNTTEVLILWAVAGGYSERLVPELLSTLDRRES